VGSSGLHKGRGTVRAALDAKPVNRVVGVDLAPEPCEKANAELGIDTTTSLDDVLTDSAVELIHISTSNASHFAIGKQALEAGKAVCMEKPMGISLQETEDLPPSISPEDSAETMRLCYAFEEAADQPWQVHER